MADSVAPKRARDKGFERTKKSVLNLRSGRRGSPPPELPTTGEILSYFPQKGNITAVTLSNVHLVTHLTKHGNCGLASWIGQRLQSIFWGGSYP